MTDEERKLYNKEFCEKMPYLFPRNVWTDKIDTDYDYEWIHGEELPKGWRALFYQMCEDIRQLLIDAGCIDRFRFSQIKEKYNTMRCYNFGAPTEVYNIIRKYEYMSRYICQECGFPATRETVGWIASYCTQCAKVNDANKGYHRIKFEPVYHIEHMDSAGNISRETIDCSNEWNRLYNKCSY